MIEMNLHTAGRSLADLIDKVENNLLSDNDHQSSSKIGGVNKSIRSSKSVMSKKNSKSKSSKKK